VVGPVVGEAEPEGDDPGPAVAPGLGEPVVALGSVVGYGVVVHVVRDDPEVPVDIGSVTERRSARLR
jgi:hypothetical protein